MTYFFLIILNFVSITYAQIEVIPVDENFPSEEISNARVVRPKRPSFKYISGGERDEILKGHELKEIKVMNEMERDIFYKSIINYDEKDILIKYPFLKRPLIKKLKHEFLAD